MAQAFAREGDDVGLIARGEAGLQAAAHDVEATGCRALAVPTDVADFDQVEAAAGTIERELGPIDIWVNDAFSSVFAPFWKIQPDEFRRTTEVAYLGFVWGTRVALDRMRPATRESSSRWARPWRTATYRCSPPTAAQSTRSRASTSRCAASCCTRAAASVRPLVQMPAVNTPQFSWVLSRLPH